MARPYLEEVFTTSGVPTHTFVRPSEYTKLVVALRTPGRGLVVEGPSGIGKTTSIAKILQELDIQNKVIVLSARNPDDLLFINELTELGEIGTVVVDDFHRLPVSMKEKIADFLKVLADTGDRQRKLIIVGINKAGDSLIRFAPDLNDRIDVVRFESNPLEKLHQLIELGESALSIELSCKDEIATMAYGSFHLTQLLCHEACLAADTTEKQNITTVVRTSGQLAKERVLISQHRRFFDLARKFASGPRLRTEGRAPYLHILNWLATGEEWSISLDQQIAMSPKQKISVGQVIDRGSLATFMRDNDDLQDIMHYDNNTHIIGIEDPKFAFFIRNLPWSKFAKQVGFTNTGFTSKYDFALSFAGSDRSHAEGLFKILSKKELTVFYDKEEQHRILAANVEDYLGPIYRTEAEFVVAFLGPEYPKKIWTKFESEQFRDRFGDSVIPIWFKNAPPGLFDESGRVGGLEFDPDKDVERQLRAIAELLVRKLRETRSGGGSAEGGK